MKKILKTIGGLVAAAGLLSVSTVAQAQEVTMRLEPGVAIPITEPQSSRFKVGGALAIKPEFGLNSYLSVGPSFAIVVLPYNVTGVDTGTLWALGGFGRLKRPHDDKNSSRGLRAVSPWVDADLQYVRTDPLNRFGWAMAVGASVPTSDERDLWVGPFVRYQSVFQEQKAGYNTNDAKIVIIGLSLELGSKKVEKVEAPPVLPTPVVVVTPKPAPPVKVVPAPTPVVVQDVNVEVTETIQFAWDSSSLDDTASSALDGVAKQITSAKSFESVKVEGYASSEGQVEHNNVLFTKRAQSVVDFLVAHNVPKEKLSATGFGSQSAVATNETEAGRILNRRVAFVVKFVVVKESK